MDSGQISVCHVVNAVDESSIPLDIARAMSGIDGINVTLVGMFGVSRTALDSDINVCELNTEQGIFVAIRELQEILKQQDIVHTHHNHSGAYAKLIGRMMGKGLVSTEHNDHDGFSRAGRVANGVTNVLAEKVTCVSNAVHESFRRWERFLIPNRKVSIVNNGIELEKLDEFDGTTGFPDQHDIAPEGVLVGNAAMLTKQKAQDTLIRAIHKANEQDGPRIELVITGEGDRRKELEHLVSTLDLDDQVHFTGFLEHRQDVYQILASVDIFSMPSRWEGFGVAVIEAMALKRPCVLSDIDVFKELFGDVGVFHPVDDVDALADRLLELAKDPEMRNQLGMRGHRHVSDQFRLSEIADEYVEIYNTIQR